MQIITFQAMSGFYPCPGSQGSSSGRGSGKSSAPNSAQRPAQGRRLHDLSTKDCSRQSWDETKVGIKAWETNPWSRRKALAQRPSRGVWALLNCDQEQNRMGTAWGAGLGWEWLSQCCHSTLVPVFLPDTVSVCWNLCLLWEPLQDQGTQVRNSVTLVIACWCHNENFQNLFHSRAAGLPVVSSKQV